MNIPLNPEQRWEWIKYQLRLRHSSLATIAREEGLSQRQAVNPAKFNAYPRVERAIAKKLGREPIDIWPERWNTDGTPVRQRPNASEIRHTRNMQENITIPLDVHRQSVAGV